MFFLRFSIAILYAYSIFVHPNLFGNSFGGGWKFLTYINMWLVAVYFSLSALGDLLKISALRKALNFIFFSLVLPSSLLVSSIFWGLYSLDRNLIFPKQLDAVYPAWLNHTVHTLVFLVALIELSSGMQRFDAPRKRYSILLFLTFAGLYIAWSHVVAHYNGSWPYPFLNKMNDQQRNFFFATSGAFGVLIWRVGFVVHDIFCKFIRSNSSAASAPSRPKESTKPKRN